MPWISGSDKINEDEDGGSDETSSYLEMMSLPLDSLIDEEARVLNLFSKQIVDHQSNTKVSHPLRKETIGLCFYK